MKTAVYWKKLTAGKVSCLLCPHACVIADGKTGLCRVRYNLNGTLYSSIYAETTSINLDPIEKKPLYHFYPGSRILSVGTNGCNFACSFCQNWEISQTEQSGRQKMSSAETVELAVAGGSIGIAYTYNEPFIWFEFVLETAKLARKKKLRNVLVTNGYVNAEPLGELLPYIDAMNIDLKSINADFYKKTCKGSLEPVKKTIESSLKQCHVELTNLLVTGKNDSETDLVKLIDYVSGLGKDVPLHFSRYFPIYKSTEPATPAAALRFAEFTAKKKLNYVYAGNLDAEKNSTCCPKCKTELIRRNGFSVEINLLKGSNCFKCGHKIPGCFK